MAELKSVPYPRFLERMASEVITDLQAHGVPDEVSRPLGEALASMLTRMADDYQTNAEQSADVVMTEASSLESHEGADAAAVHDSGTATDGQVLTADGSGNAEWQTPVHPFLTMGA